MHTYKANSLNDLTRIAENFRAEFTSDIIFAFYGKMGSGKTTFIKEFCRQLGVKDVITSPTFALINEYTGENDIKIFHFDFYRIETIEEAYDFGYEEYFYSGDYCFIEWPELIENLLPETFVKVSIIEDEMGNRIFTAEKIINS